MKRKILDLTIMLICTSVFLWCAYPYINQKDTKDAEAFSNNTEKTGADFTIWYTDDNIKDYLEDSAYKFNTRINLVQVSALDYLENINQLNQSGEGAPDLYILDSEMLEKAYLAGLASENYDRSYNKDNYPDVSLCAATYHDKLVAYPFYFNTSFLVYNKDYVSEAPESFDDILAFANTFDAASKGVENILQWDVKDIIYNYGFVGNYIEFGGKNGDDDTKLEFDRDQLFNALSYYYNLHQYFSIDINTVNYDTVVDNFINGKTVFALMNVQSVAKLNKSGVNYKITDFPNITDELKSKNISATKVAVVNPYSENIKKSEEFAKFLTYDNAENIYGQTGYMASRQLDKYLENGLKDVMKQYKITTNLPKLMSTRDVWLQLQNMLGSVWNGSDINSELDGLKSKIDSYKE